MRSSSKRGASAAQWERFEKSLVWKEICEWLGERRENYLQDLIQAQEVDHIRFIQGALNELEVLKMLPGTLSDTLNIKKRIDTADSGEDYEGEYEDE